MRVYEYASPTEVRILLTGAATKHKDPVDDTDIQFIFDAGMMATNNITKVWDTKVDFITPAKVSISPNTFVEDSRNDGTTTDKITINFTDDVIASGINNANVGNYIQMTPPITGFIPQYNMLNDSTIEVSLNGAATNHARANSATAAGGNPIRFAFLGNLFQDRIGIPAASSPPVDVTFLNQVTVTPIPRDSFIEDFTTEGTINNNAGGRFLTLRTSEDLKNTIPNNSIIPDTLFTMSSNLPRGLRATIDQA